jgi:cell division protein FtsB
MSGAAVSVWKRLVDYWPILLAVVTLVGGLYVKVELQGLQITQNKTEIATLKAEAKEIRAEAKAYENDIRAQLKELNGGIQRLEVGLAQLVAIQKAQTEKHP